MRSGDGGHDGDGAEPVGTVESALERIGAFGRRRGGPGGRPGHGAPNAHDRGHEGAHPHHGRRARLAGIARGRVLDALARADGALSIGEVGELVGVDQPRASRLVQALVEAGHARRTVDPVDARRSAIMITDAGREALERARASRREAIAAALDGFSDEERERFAELLGRFAAAWPRD
ncbi:hypothetical protein ARHIZOSPH14_16220 [Agromyces rhizosphaerae]|uniref:HTH marR-type domain-containing protein n=1 Tax=Agromyces rhizosphaerae TaxID=88374 RepID=A0A9W6CXB8_9MICO|nr:MarR family transcriptional regulator [Agromyces rhizosphaerae]GLI27380.1 hypothetical protein ARHIZOSPH14_16220 [Agromyces rhizosphaerae]